MYQVDVSFWPMDKILALPVLVKKVEALKAQGKKIVSINGSFDLLHGGHLNFLGEAKAQGDILVVAVNSDASIKARKGANRPFVREQERAGLLAALIYTDFVTILDASYEELPLVFIRAIKPHVHVNGAEYGAPETWWEWPAMQEVHATGYAVARREGLATSELVKKIQGSV